MPQKKKFIYLQIINRSRNFYLFFSEVLPLAYRRAHIQNHTQHCRRKYPLRAIAIRSTNSEPIKLFIRGELGFLESLGQSETERKQMSKRTKKILTIYFYAFYQKEMKGYIECIIFTLSYFFKRYLFITMKTVPFVIFFLQTKQERYEKGFLPLLFFFIV